MPLESYPQPQEIVVSQTMTRQVAFSEGQAKNIGGGSWTIRRRVRASGVGRPAETEVISGQGPIWISKGAWTLPGGVEQPLEGYHYVADPGVVRVDDTLESDAQAGLIFSIVTVEGETGFTEGKCRLLP